MCNQGDIRLQGGANNRTGRVEICNSHEWGTVCDDIWGEPDAQVACRQLGFASTGTLPAYACNSYMETCSPSIDPLQ